MDISLNNTKLVEIETLTEINIIGHKYKKNNVLINPAAILFVSESFNAKSYLDKFKIRELYLDGGNKIIITDNSFTKLMKKIKTK